MISDFFSTGRIEVDISDDEAGLFVADDDYSYEDIDEMLQCLELLESGGESIIGNKHFLNYIALNELHIDGYCFEEKTQVENNRLAMEHYLNMKPVAQQKVRAEFSECIRGIICEINTLDPELFL